MSFDEKKCFLGPPELLRKIFFYNMYLQTKLQQHVLSFSLGSVTSDGGIYVSFLCLLLQHNLECAVNPRTPKKAKKHKKAKKDQKRPKKLPAPLELLKVESQFFFQRKPSVDNLFANLIWPKKTKKSQNRPKKTKKDQKYQKSLPVPLHMLLVWKPIPCSAEILPGQFVC